jgi:hypothetical protein
MRYSVSPEPKGLPQPIYIYIYIYISESSLILDGPHGPNEPGPRAQMNSLDWAQVGPGPNEWAQWARPRAQMNFLEWARARAQMNGPNGPWPEWAQMDGPN